MGWEVNNRGVPVYVIKKRIGGKVTSIVVGPDDLGRQAEEARARKRYEIKRLKGSLKHERDQFTLREELFYSRVEQDLINKGYIRRHRRWLRIESLRKPLTKEERAYIKSVKAISTPSEFTPANLD